VATVYSICKKISGEGYVGCTGNDSPFTRWGQHITKLKSHNHSSKKLQKAWGDSKLEDWEFTILESNIPDNQKSVREQYWFDRTDHRLNGTRIVSLAIQRDDLIVSASQMLDAGRTFREIKNECGCSIGWLSTLKNRTAIWAQKLPPGAA